MRRVTYFLVLFSIICFGHKQHVHQYITKQAYYLLEDYLNFTVPEMSVHLDNGPVGPPWTNGTLLAGAWREDEEDIMYHYDQIVPGDWNHSLLSITHFWDADEGNFTENTFDVYLSFFTGTIGPYPNSYTKIINFAYPNRFWEIEFIMPPAYSDFRLASGELITIHHGGGVGIEYNSLIELYTTGHAWITGYYEYPTEEWLSCNFEVILSQGYRDALVWEILGRMCHLIQDVSVPAHTHRDEHGLDHDQYEDWVASNYTYWNHSNVGNEILDPFISSNPIHFLMYTTQQIANHFGSTGPYEGVGNDVLGGDYLPEEINYLNNVGIQNLGQPTYLSGSYSTTELENIRNKTVPQAIKATAGLLYWFAIESGLLESSKFENSFGTGIVRVNGINEPSGYKISVVNNPTVQLEAVDQGVYRFYSWEKYVNGVLSSISYQRSFTASLGANVTYKAVFRIPANNETLPQNISSNTILYGSYICNGTTITNSTLTILSGTTIKLKTNKGITVYSGSKIIANGTAADPIVLERKDICSGPPLPKVGKANSLLELPGDDCSWLAVNLEGDNNQFTYCIFDGGTFNVSVQSNNNSFSHCTFKNAIRGVSSSSINGGNWGSFSLDNCLIENNTYGIVANSVYAEITNTEIKNNDEYGMYLYNARMGQNTGSGGLFTNNYVHNNGTYGVRIDYNGQLWLGYGSVKGNNKICNNGSHEIYVSSSSSSSRLYQSSYNEGGSDGGYSDIYDVNFGFYVYNLAQTYNGEYYISLTQLAENNYWNTATVLSPYWFYGSVDRSPFKTSSQYVSPPSPSIVSNETSDLKQLVTAGMVKSIANNIQDEEKVTGFIDIKQKLLDLKSYIRNNPDSLICARYLKELYSIQITRDPANSLGEKASIIDLIKEKRTGLENSFNSRSIKKSTQLIGEVAMILEADELINNKKYKETLEKINGNVKYIKNYDNKRETLLQKLNIYEELGGYENALSTLLELEEIVKHFEKGIIYTQPDYEIIKSNLKERIGSSEKVLLVKASSSFPSSETNAPLTYSLYQNYPNPFNPSTTISFSLPEPSEVTIDIYSITGELVKHLITDQNYEPGIHNINFDAGSYASGVYLVRVRMNSLASSNSIHSFTKKIVLLK